MKPWRRLTGLTLAALLCVSLLGGCTGAGAADGVSLSVCVGAAPVTLDPIYAEEISDQTILEHLYENLMRLSVDVSGKATVTNGMAKNVTQEANYDGSVTYTFKLRSAKWSDGRSVQAKDFVYAWRRLANPDSQSPYAELLSVVKGYDEARASGDMEQMQVSAKNDSTLVVVLSGNYDWFLREVCTSPATMPLRQDIVKQLKAAAEEKKIAAAQDEDAQPARWWSDPTALVTNGPYRAEKYESGALLETVACERYYGTQAGPKELAFRFADTADEAWQLYQGKTVDAVWPLPQSRMEELAADETWTGIPKLGTYSVLFNCDTVQDVTLRQALSLAIDRNALAETAGVGANGAEGLVPPGVPESEKEDFRTADSPLLDNDPARYEENCAQARALLEQAGYDSGADLGALEYLYIEGDGNAKVAKALCQQWGTVLRVSVTPRGVTKQEFWAALRGGTYSIAGAEVEAVGNDAECFLMRWTSGNQDNVTGYANSAYDTLMSIIAGAEDGMARMGCLHDAEELLLTDYVLAPLYTDVTAWELRDTFTGACRDARGWFVFSGVVPRAS
ncbi:peptide ABC transporter substrate-binding protein [Oscillibacter sp.]|uniref:peptide ABC transporter substrate-binding protein n=1 Tax=Oscillibacter sp. TaxID=1945593 RepID=UPI00260168CA|nr:peptide ABC transporter substrate-binding protein [Oscillibacter sp.]MDD3347714.1 peptide ABC transporter substrate-binding protein [Oscillibacter sp.]